MQALLALSCHSMQHDELLTSPSFDPRLTLRAEIMMQRAEGALLADPACSELSQLSQLVQLLAACDMVPADLTELSKWHHSGIGVRVPGWKQVRRRPA